MTPPTTDQPLRWAIVIVDLHPATGHEQAGQRRAVVVSYEAYHRSGLATVCPISARPPRYPGEVAIPAGEAGETLDASILCHQVRTIDVARISSLTINGRRQAVTDAGVRRRVREALMHHLGLDLPARADGAA